MEELQIITLENTDIGHWDMATIREQLEQNLAYYRGIIYTDDNIKSAKDNRAILNKAKSVIEDARKAYKEKCLEPYKAMEPQIKADYKKFVSEHGGKLLGSISHKMNVAKNFGVKVICEDEFFEMVGEKYD